MVAVAKELTMRDSIQYERRTYIKRLIIEIRKGVLSIQMPCHIIESIDSEWKGIDKENSTTMKTID